MADLTKELNNDMKYSEAIFYPRIKRARKINLINGFWILAFLTFPLLALRHLRFNVGQLHVAIFIVALFAVALLHIVKICIDDKSAKLSLNKTQRLFLLAFFLFVALHFLNGLRAIDLDRTIAQLTKLFVALVATPVLLIFFPRDRIFLRKIINLIIIASTILLLAYCYRYIFVFKAKFLGIDWGKPTLSGRGMIGVWLTFSLPIVAWKWLNKGILSIWIIPVIVHLFSAIYSLDRATWVALAFSPLILLLIFANKGKKERQHLVLIAILILFIVSIAYSIYSIPELSNIRQFNLFHARIQTLLSLSDNEGEGSISARKEFIKESIIEFVRSPILGIGTSNFMAKYGLHPHNDYLQILCEQGLIGITIFFFMLFLVIRKILRIDNDSWEVIGLKNSILAILIHMLFSDIYKTTILYIFIGLFLTIEKSKFIIKDNDEDFTYRTGKY